MTDTLALFDTADTAWVALLWSHNPPMLQRFKNVVPWKDRRWDRTAHQWRIAAAWVPAVVALADKHGFCVTDHRKCNFYVFETEGVTNDRS